MTAADIQGLFAAVPEGWSSVVVGGRRYGLTRTVSAGGRIQKVYAEELGGTDVVSANLYAGGVFRPCEMPAATVVAFLERVAAGSGSPRDAVTGAAPRPAVGGAGSVAGDGAAAETTPLPPDPFDEERPDPGRGHVMADDKTGAAKVAELAKDIRIAMLTTMDGEGHHISRPMAQQEVEFDGDLWFYAERDSRKVRHIAANAEVGVTLSSADTWISIEGEAVVVDDLAKKKELWNAVVGAWFTDGPEDPNVVLIKIEAHGAEYWDTPGGRVASVISFVKAKVTGKPYDGGENERVDL